MPGLVGVLVAVGMLAIVPLGFALLDTPGLRPLRLVWPVLGALATVSLLLRPGTVAGLLTVPYAAGCLLAALAGLRRWRGGTAVRELAAFAAVGFLPVAASGLVPERFGVGFLGFGPATLGLTAAHFHFAGFAAAVLAGLAYAAAPRPAALAGALAIPGGTAVVLVGYFTGEYVELLGAVVLAAGLLATSWVVLRDVLPRAAGATRALFAASALATPVTMALAVWWALGEAAGLPHLTLTQTAATHGVLNALAVAVAGLVGWYRLSVARL